MAGEPIIKLDASVLGDLSAKASGISSRIDTPVNGIANILGALDWKVKSQSGIEYDLKNVRNELQKQGSQLGSLNRVIVDATGRIDTTTASLNAKTDAIAMQAAATASRGADMINPGSAAAAMSAVAAALTAALPFQTNSMSTSISSGIKNWFYNLFHGSHGGNSGGGHSSGGGMHDGGGMHYEEPTVISPSAVVDGFLKTKPELNELFRRAEYYGLSKNTLANIISRSNNPDEIKQKIQAEVDAKAHERYLQNKQELNDRLTVLYSNKANKYYNDCPALVNDQLKAQGINLGAADDGKGNRIGGPTHNGNVYVRKQFSQFTKDKAAENDGYYCDIYLCEYGANSNEKAQFEKLLADNNEPITNVVLSFSAGSSYHISETAGHTMLISKIEDGKVYFTDNLGGNGPLMTEPEPLGTGGEMFRGRTCCLTVEKFEEFYIDILNCNGMAVIKHI